MDQKADSTLVRELAELRRSLEKPGCWGGGPGEEIDEGDEAPASAPPEPAQASAPPEPAGAP